MANPQALDVVVEALREACEATERGRCILYADHARDLLAKLAALDESRRAAQEEATMTTPPTPALALVVEELASRKHYECEDSWYSCPLSDEGCANEKECTCGASRDHELAALLQNLAPPDAIRAAEPKIYTKADAEALCAIAVAAATNGAYASNCERIEKRLMEHRLSYTHGDDGDAYPLVDRLVPDGETTIETGRKEIELLAENIANLFGKPTPPSPPAHEHGQGYKLVPVEPTIAMIDAGLCGCMDNDVTACVYRNMLAAAPEPPRD